MGQKQVQGCQGESQVRGRRRLGSNGVGGGDDGNINKDGHGNGDHAIALLSLAAVAGRVLQAFVDLALGCLTAAFLVAHVDAIVRVAMGGAWAESGWRVEPGSGMEPGLSLLYSDSRDPPSPAMPLWGEVVRTNANWIMRGDPLGGGESLAATDIERGRTSPSTLRIRLRARTDREAASTHSQHTSVTPSTSKYARARNYA